MTTNNTNTTPGPWRVGLTRTKVGRRYVDSLAVFPNNGTTVCVVSSHALIQRDSARDEANARLIAAAPELLAALVDLANNVETDLSGYWTESTSNFMQQARAAIAKATQS